RERSVKQMINRVVDWYSERGLGDGYFSTSEGVATFRDELSFLLVRQFMAFNSPVWFNVGLVEPPRVSACFILDVEDEMSSILNWYVEEGLIFKAGSGAGVNLSKLRSSREHLKSGGTASGPVSFMRGADASAGTIKSGGSTRRAAKMVVLDVDHPDVEEFINCKVKEERKARVLREAGFEMDLDGADSYSLQYQNANNSVGLTDEFIQAYLGNRDWDLKAVGDGSVLKSVKARDLMRQIAQAAWECADPGVFYLTTMNRWHTSPSEGPIRATNPCFTGDTRVHTDKGLVRFDDLVIRAARGETFGIYTHDATNKDAPAECVELTNPTQYMVTGVNEVLRLKFSNGMEVRATPNHKFFTTNRGMVPAAELTEADKVKVLNVATPAAFADWALPLAALEATSRKKGEQRQNMNLPEKWSEELADYLGWLIGDGCFSNGGFSTIYGSKEDQSEILPRHQRFLKQITGGREPKVSVQENGTQQLRVTRHALIRFIEALGLKRATAPDKDVPSSIFEAPQEIQAAFLRSLFDADGCVSLSQKEKGSRYVGLYSRSEALLQNVQRLLSGFGVRSRIYAEKRVSPRKGFTYTRKDGTHVEYSSETGFDLRIFGRSIREFHERIGFSLSNKSSKLQEAIGHEFYSVDESARLVSKESDGYELTYNLTEPRNHSYVVGGLVTANCGEYVRPANTSCNLASLRLTKFLDADGSFNVRDFISAIETTLTAMDISVTNAEYPTEKITEMVANYRELGLGYTDLGALLMDQGIAYDSDAGRAWAAATTALMSGVAYRRSAEIASVLGPYPGWHKAGNSTAHLDVIRKHRAALDEIDGSLVPEDIVSAARKAWDDALEMGEKYGYRNAQVTLIAPTGTISFLMDADTTGIEPDLALVKTKKLVGGGSMKIVNQRVPSALKRLGYLPNEVSEIVSYISENNTVKGAPFMKPEHHSVFDCAMGESPIHYMGHVKMMSAVQPFLSGAISKTVNMPEDATVDDIESLYVEGWHLGLKNLAIYRDNCKVGQPLSADRKSDKVVVAGHEAKAPVTAEGPVRRRLPRKRNSRTMSFRIADCDGYVMAGEYPDTEELGEIFLKVAKQGSTLSGIMDAFAISVSLGLQYGVPLKAYVEKFVNMRFEPSGVTDDPDFRFASSIVDYIFRRLGADYLSEDDREANNIKTTLERQEDLDGGLPIVANGHSKSPDTELTLTQRPISDAPFCYTCGISMRRAGSCFACESCG
ncbi:MAG TPA: LAGLIDADG family homing endonuclease, partial [Actinomycetota bacterium]|nr:LAGLIDADG family homing endonuclease [Actinomycetota bacterium]